MSEKWGMRPHLVHQNRSCVKDKGVFIFVPGIGSERFNRLLGLSRLMGEKSDFFLIPREKSKKKTVNTNFITTSLQILLSDLVLLATQSILFVLSQVNFKNELHFRQLTYTTIYNSNWLHGCNKVL